MPRGFHAYRGIFGPRAERTLVKVVEAWQESKPAMQMPQEGIASWTLSQNIGEHFASMPPVGRIVGILFEADIPFNYTLADVWVDTEGFPNAYEKEIVVGLLNGNLEIPKEHIKVAYNGKLYTYGDRNELIAQWMLDNKHIG
ncbi:MAG: hypothetical protein HQM16_17990 [Deltaproteobacteria bacterium]|nr:hypothetical protein [Deltaproteobacteria bacterium]